MALGVVMTILLQITLIILYAIKLFRHYPKNKNSVNTTENEVFHFSFDIQFKDGTTKLIEDISDVSFDNVGIYLLTINDQEYYFDFSLIKTGYITKGD